MNDVSFVQKLIKHYRLLVVFGISLLVLLILNSYAFVRVNVTGQNGAQAQIELRENGKKVSTLKPGSLRIVSKGDFSLRASAGDQLSEKSVNLDSFRINEPVIDLAAIKQLDKISSNGQDCIFADGDPVTAAAVYSFNCSGGVRTARYVAAPKPSALPWPGRPYLYAPASYREGVLAFVVDPNEGITAELFPLSLVRSSGTTELGFLADPTLNMSNYHVLTSTKEDGSFEPGFFIANDAWGELTYMNSPSDKTPQKATIKSDYTSKSTFHYATKGSTAYVLIIPPNVGETREEDAHKQPGGTLKKFVAEDSGLREVSSFKLPDGIAFFDFFAVNNNTLAARNLSGQITLYTIEGDTIQEYDRIQSSDDMLPYKGGLVYRQGQDYMQYELATKGAYRVYRLRDFTPSRMQNYDGRLIISGFAGQGGAHHSFALVDTSPTNGLEKILTYPTEDTDIRSIDYDGTSIFVKFSLTSAVSDHATGTFSFDPQEIATKKSKLLVKMQNDGIDPSRYTIISL